MLPLLAWDRAWQVDPPPPFRVEPPGAAQGILPTRSRRQGRFQSCLEIIPGYIMTIKKARDFFFTFMNSVGFWEEG